MGNRRFSHAFSVAPVDGMNGFFHVGSALGAVALAWALLMVQKQRNMLRTSIKALAAAEAKGSGQVAIESPGRWLAGFAKALGVSYENPDSWDLPPRRIEVAGWLRLVLAQPVSLIRCRQSSDSSGTMIVELLGPGGDARTVTLGKENA